MELKTTCVQHKPSGHHITVIRDLVDGIFLRPRNEANSSSYLFEVADELVDESLALNLADHVSVIVVPKTKKELLLRTQITLRPGEMFLLERPIANGAPYKL